MKFLFLDAYFEPEQIAFTHLENDLLEGLVSTGHEIEVICPTPTRGISKEIAEKYQRRRYETLYDGHVHVKRFYAPQEGKNPIARAFRYFWCNLRTYQLGKKCVGIDTVFSNSTPPTQGWIAGKVAKKLGVPFIYSLQDIFPDSLVTTGLTNQGSVLWIIGRRLEHYTYHLCSHIIVISEQMRNNLLEKGVPPEKISVIHNWVDLDEMCQVERDTNSLFDEYGIDRKKFIVLYAGNFGAAQGAEIVLDVAENLQNDRDIQFAVFGGGAGFLGAEERASQLNNVFIHTLLPQNRVSEVYSMGNVAIISCKKGAGKSAMPSKTWSIMACNTPIIASFDEDSELSEIIRELNAGVCVPPEKVDEIVIAIRRIKNGDFVFSERRKYVLENNSKDACVKQYIRILSHNKGKR